MSSGTAIARDAAAASSTDIVDSRSRCNRLSRPRT